MKQVVMLKLILENLDIQFGVFLLFVTEFWFVEEEISITAMSNEGLLGLHLTYGMVNANMFADFVRGTLIPEMESFDGHRKSL